MSEWGGANESLKDDGKRGLYGKYHVERADGKSKGPYFVLAYTTDPHARAALAAYAESCADEFPLLALDLLVALQKTPVVGGVTASVPSSQGPCICPEGAVVPDCPRHAYAWDYVGQDPFKSRIAEDAWFNGARPS